MTQIQARPKHLFSWGCQCGSGRRILVKCQLTSIFAEIPYGGTMTVGGHVIPIY